MPLEIPQELKTEETYKREGLYIIGGWATSWNFGGRIEYAMAWGGYFKRDSEKGIIEGQLIDEHGPSTIMGSLNPEIGSLDFTKYYGNRFNGTERKLQYIFTRKESGLWEGGFTMDELTGRALCRVDQVVDDAFRIAFVGPNNFEPPWTRFAV